MGYHRRMTFSVRQVSVAYWVRSNNRSSLLTLLDHERLNLPNPNAEKRWVLVPIGPSSASWRCCKALIGTLPQARWYTVKRVLFEGLRTSKDNTVAASF